MTTTLPSPYLTLPTLHGDPLAEFIHYPTDQLLYLRWHGHLTAEEVIRVGQAQMDEQARLRCPRLLNDKRDTTGDWHEALPWLQYDWLPRVMSYGLHAVGFALSPDLSQQMASHEFVDTIHTDLVVKTFHDVSQTWDWLMKH